jgi:hypothetical protein
MPYCPKCGNEVSEQAKFCSNCGQELAQPATKEAKPPSEKYSSKWRSALRYLVMEAVAIVGSINFPIRSYQTNYYDGLLYDTPRYHSVPITRTVYFQLFENTGAIIAFLIIAAGVNLYFIRHQSTKVQVITTIILVGVLLATVLGIKSLNLR